MKVGGDLLKKGGDSSSAKRCGAATPRGGGHGRGFPGLPPGNFCTDGSQIQQSGAFCGIILCFIDFSHALMNKFAAISPKSTSTKQKLETCRIYIFNEWFILCTNSNWESYKNLKLEGTCFTAPKPTWFLNYNWHNKNSLLNTSIECHSVIHLNHKYIFIPSYHDIFCMCFFKSEYSYLMCATSMVHMHLVPNGATPSLFSNLNNFLSLSTIPNTAHSVRTVQQSR